ncbi:MAG: hypothetical protein KDD70_18045, partial [Bdellovibrionales bacterium]|nr:hypothetical protein [Bdellovibrionales bacterium]
SRLIKSSIYTIIGNFPGRLCYLYSDALAVSDSIDDIFRFDFAPVCFSPDHFMTVSKFAKYALAPENPWNLDLGAALRHEFSVEIPADWPLWNGGMFTFSAEAEQFFDRWNANTRRILHSEYWLSRDQTSLIATVFQMNMHDNKTIPSEFNWLVRHSGRWNSRTNFDERGFSYDGKKIHVMHFIPGFDSSYGDTSVREWTQVRQLLETDIEK